MDYIVLDMEWNQPYRAKQIVKQPVKLYGEIVQIGAVKLDSDFNLVDTFKMMVTPKYYTRMNKNVSRLTKITTEELQNGVAFPLAFDCFKQWCGEDFAILTWGPDDIRVLRDNLTLHELDPEWIPDTYNLQLIFDSQITKERRQVSLTDAMEMIGEPALEAHDALNDAKNTACICQRLDMKTAIDEYRQINEDSKKPKKRKKKKSPEEKTYRTRRSAISDPEITRFFCPVCGEKAVCSGFARQSTDKYICVARCESGDELFVRFKLTKCANGRFKASRLIYEMNEENRDFYRRKRQHIKSAEPVKCEEAQVDEILAN